MGDPALPEPPPAGFVLVDKPAGLTSHALVARARREHGLRAGHAGTLDPFATGLIVILLGQATRLQRYVLGLPKTYEATARLGWRSSTGDPDGVLEQTGRLPQRLELPTGSVTQRVPMTSAVRVEGERLYRKAHRGETVERPERVVEVYSAELLEAGEERARFRIRCSAGTYIRTLIEELGDAYCEQLRRTRVGDLQIEDAGPQVHPVEQLVGHLPARELTPGEARDVIHGRRVAAEGAEEGPLRLLAAGRLVAVAVRLEGELRTEVVLA